MIVQVDVGSVSSPKFLISARQTRDRKDASIEKTLLYLIILIFENTMLK